MNCIVYEETFGPVRLPEGFEQMLKALPLEKQTSLYRTTRRYFYSVTGWSKRTADDGYRRLEDEPAVSALIVKDGIIVGVMMKNHRGYERPCLAERCICTYSASDNNGAGYKERADYTYLLCVPEAFDRTQVEE